MGKIQTVPQLVALTQGVVCRGEHACYLCGAPADGRLKREERIRETFTGRETVRRPGSSVLCEGCGLCLREACEVPLCDGTRRFVSKAAMRAYSWLVTPERLVAASKGHLAWLRAMALADHPAPWALSLAVSGQKQLLYRGVVNYASGPTRTVTLEGEPIDYSVAQLQRYLTIATAIAAVCGRSGVAEGISAGAAVRLLDAYPEIGPTLLTSWTRLTQESSPAWRLALFLCPSKEEASGVSREAIDPSSFEL